MPIALRPDKMFRVVLDLDKNGPKKNQPCFLFRHLSCRDLEEVRKMVGSFKKTTTDGFTLDKIFRVLEDKIAGWEGMIDPATKEKIKFSPKNIRRLLTPAESIELFTKYYERGIVG